MTWLSQAGAKWTSEQNFVHWPLEVHFWGWGGDRYGPKPDDEILEAAVLYSAERKLAWLI